MEQEDEKPRPFKPCRPWESPPKEEGEGESPSTSNGNGRGEDPQVPLDVKVKTEPQDSSWTEEVEVFSFDRERLVLTSEKVKVKRDSTSNELPQSSSDSSSSSDFKGRKNGNDLKNDEEQIKVEVKLDPDAFNDDDSYQDGEDGSMEDDETDSDEDDDDDDEEEDEDMDSDEKMEMDEDFPEGRNKERKNSKWADYGVTRKSSRLRSKTKFCSKAHKAQLLKKLTSVLKKDDSELTEEDQVNLAAFPELVKEAKNRLEKRKLASERMKEEEDPEELLEKKCLRLAQVINKAKYLVLYTGAGISTSASIPDYRGPNGIWTLLRKGQSIADDLKQFPQSADPTLTHMAIKELYSRGIIKHIVSQNVDGLHLRSGISKVALSEVHGNMYVEVCNECHREYVRLFDVTEKTKRHHHKTGRYCYHCGSALKDSVVLFGEKGSLRWPINWAGAEYNVDKADVILCLGSSLKVLRRYPWLWSMSKPANQRPKLYIVNLQWTPKDRFAALKINGRCDEVIARIMDHLNISIPAYKRELDPIFTIATLLHPSEAYTKLSKDLTLPEGVQYPGKSTDLQNYFRFEPMFSKEVRALNQVKRKIVDGEDENEKDNVSSKSKSCGIGWLGNALSVKPKKKKVK